MKITISIRTLALAGMAFWSVNHAYATPLNTKECPTVEQLQKFEIYYSELDEFDTQIQKFIMSAGLSQNEAANKDGWLLGIHGVPIEYNDDLRVKLQERGKNELQPLKWPII
ncbi:TPA: hypothetical protein KKX77_002640 [Legionella pneumophila]|nr:hypothetical protein [Legionella pneumophila]HCU5995169.1 hypothetical protein [Legionella pneumophila]